MDLSLIPEQKGGWNNWFYFSLILVHFACSANVKLLLFKFHRRRNFHCPRSRRMRKSLRRQPHYHPKSNKPLHTWSVPKRNKFFRQYNACCHCDIMKLTVSARASTIGNAKLLITKPIVKKIDSSWLELVPEKLSAVKRRAAIVGNIDKQ